MVKISETKTKIIDLELLLYLESRKQREIDSSGLYSLSLFYYLTPCLLLAENAPTESVFVFYVVKISGIKAKINLFLVDSFYNLKSSWFWARNVPTENAFVFYVVKISGIKAKINLFSQRTSFLFSPCLLTTSFAGAALPCNFLALVFVPFGVGGSSPLPSLSSSDFGFFFFAFFFRPPFFFF